MPNPKSQKYINISVSIPKKLLEAINSKRGTTKRSPYICALIAEHLGVN